MKQQDFTIRQLTQADLDTLIRDFPQPTPSSHEKRLRLQDQSKCTYSCLEINSTIVAIQLIRWNGPPSKLTKKLSSFPEIGSLYVLPAYRGMGLATKLVEYSEAYIKDRGYQGIGAAIKDSNEISIRMHVARGYEPVGEAPPTKQHPDETRTYFVKKLY